MYSGVKGGEKYRKDFVAIKTDSHLLSPNLRNCQSTLSHPSSTPPTSPATHLQFPGEAETCYAKSTTKFATSSHPRSFQRFHYTGLLFQFNGLNVFKSLRKISLILDFQILFPRYNQWG